LALPPVQELGHTGQEAQHHGAAEVDGQRADRKRPDDPARHRAVDDEAHHRTDAANRHPDPDHCRHCRTRTRRTSFVARYTATKLAEILVAV
jgi:hypothetical protein